MGKSCNIIIEGKYSWQKLSENANYDIGNWVIAREFFTIEVQDGAKLSLGDNVFFNNYSSIRCRSELVIGKNTTCGDGVRIYDYNHDYSNYHIERNTYHGKPVHIGENCWICANCVILPGANIGDNVIIGAGCVIHGDIPPNTIVYNDAGMIKMKKREQKNKHCLVFTLSDQLLNLEYLLEKLPEVDFHIAAPCSPSNELKQLKRYHNFQLYTLINQNDINDLINRCNIYLDINCYDECCNALRLAHDNNIPILTFDSVKHSSENNITFPDEEPELMVEKIKELLYMV